MGHPVLIYSIYIYTTNKRNFKERHSCRFPSSCNQQEGGDTPFFSTSTQLSRHHKHSQHSATVWPLRRLLGLQYIAYYFLLLLTVPVHVLTINTHMRNYCYIGK